MGTVLDPVATAAKERANALFRTQWFGRVSTLHIYIYISHRDKSEVQGGEQGSGGTSHGRVAAPTHPRNQTTVGHTSLPLHQNKQQKTQTRSNQTTLLFSFSHSFIW